MKGKHLRHELNCSVFSSSAWPVCILERQKWSSTIINTWTNRIFSIRSIEECSSFEHIEIPSSAPAGVLLEYLRIKISILCSVLSCWNVLSLNAIALALNRYVDNGLNKECVRIFMNLILHSTVVCIEAFNRFVIRMVAIRAFSTKHNKA